MVFSSNKWFAKRRHRINVSYRYLITLESKMGTEKESESISRIGIGTDKIQTIPNPKQERWEPKKSITIMPSELLHVWLLLLPWLSEEYFSKYFLFYKPVCKTWDLNKHMRICKTYNICKPMHHGIVHLCEPFLNPIEQIIRFKYLHV